MNGIIEKLKPKGKEFTYNVIIFDCNRNEFVAYDVISYLMYAYKNTRPKMKPKTLEEFADFIDKELKYQFWSRCEYEMILKDWPCGRTEKKIDIYNQCCLNLELITILFYWELKRNRYKLKF